MLKLQKQEPTLSIKTGASHCLVADVLDENQLIQANEKLMAKFGRLTD